MSDDNAGATASRSRASEPLVLALIGLGVAALLFAASAVPVILSRGDDAAEGPVFTTVPNPVAVTSTTPSATTELQTTEPPTTESQTTEPPTTESQTTEPPTTEPLSADAVPESVAVVLGGKIYLEGAVPDEAARDEIVALAAEIFTIDNVIDNYIIDLRASDPNLGNIRVDDTVLFRTESARIQPDFEPLLNQGLALLTIRPAATFVIEGHTDSRGSDEYNLELSQDRADAIVDWYVERGVSRSRLTAIGRGETQPISSDETAAGREENRRIEVTIENLLVGDA